MMLQGNFMEQKMILYLYLYSASLRITLFTYEYVRTRIYLYLVCTSTIIYKASKGYNFTYPLLIIMY